MIRALAARMVSSFAVMLGISIIVFLIFFETPGADPASRIAGRGANAETLATVRKDFGFDQPLPVQYARLMVRIFVTQDLTSFVSRGEKVVPQVRRAAPVTFALVLGAMILWLSAGLLIGLIGAGIRGRLVDHLIVSLGIVGISLPAFWLAEIVNLVTQSRYHDTWLFSWVPALGGQSGAMAPLPWALGMVMPSITLAILFAGVYGRFLQAALIEVLQQDHIRTARGLGATETRVMLHHAFRLSTVSIVAILGLDVGGLIGGGTILIEVVFGIDGIGRLLYNALLNLDLPVIMTVVLYSAFFVVVANAIADLVQKLLDPRLQ